MRIAGVSVLAVLLAAPCLSTPLWAAEPGSYDLAIKDHRFTPERLEVPADTKLVLVIRNEDSSPEEFESHDLKREKVVRGGESIRVIVGPLKAGEYAFVGEYHEDTAKGVLVVK